MKTLLVCILVSVLTVDVRGDGGEGGPIRGGFPGFLGFPGGFGSVFCGPDDEYGKVGSKCSCTGLGRRNSCRGVVGTQVIGCLNTNQYLQCNGQVCSNLTCATGQVWNKTQNACAACTSGMHVANNSQICVCDRGTTFDPKIRSCVACPTDSTQEVDRCYCPITKALDYEKNACKDCPAGSILNQRGECQCGATQFWNENDWACEDCPGEWLPKSVTSKRFQRVVQKCTCTGTNQIFDRENVKCYTCPSGTTASYAECKCASRYQFFNMDTQKCECVKGLEADAAGTGCVRSAITTTPTPAPQAP